MNLDYVERFVDATVRVLEQALQVGFGRGEVCLLEGTDAHGELAVAVPLGGEMDGVVTLRLSRETALRLFNHVTGGRHESLPPLGMDYLKELGNMIAGAAASALNDEGHDVTVAPPLADDSALRADLQGIETCRIPIYSAFGNMAVNVTLTTT